MTRQATAEAHPESASAGRLPTVAELRAEIPVDDDLATRIAAQRAAIRDVLSGADDRLLVICGPCSIHDIEAAHDYAERLAGPANRLSDELLIVMRVYVEKPRTTVGWKGLMHDPLRDGCPDPARGLAMSRRLMTAIADRGLPVATELLTPAAVDYVSDTLAWGAIGARTVESQTHRECMSGLALPVGFKNTTSGAIQPACDAMAAAARPQQYIGTGADGFPRAIATQGNPDTHLILRGGDTGPNHHAGDVAAAGERLRAAGLNPRLVVDASHANSHKTAARQPGVLADLVARRAAGEAAIAGVMLESFITHGKQPDTGATVYGQSITDECLGWAETERALTEAAATLARRR